MRMRQRALKIWIWTFKIIPDLWLSAIFCPIKKIKITPPYWSSQLFQPKLRYRHMKAQIQLVILAVLIQAQVQEHVGTDTAGHPSHCCPSSGTGSCRYRYSWSSQLFQSKLRYRYRQAQIQLVPALQVIPVVLVQAQVQAHVGTDTAGPRMLVTLVDLVNAQLHYRRK